MTDLRARASALWSGAARLARGLVGKGAARTRAARAAEARGDLEEATRLLLEAGQSEDAARLFLARAEATLDTTDRLALLALASAHAPETHDVGKKARHARDALLVASAHDGAIGAGDRHSLREAGEALEAAGDNDAAADAFRKVGDADAEARVRAKMGDVDGVEDVLARAFERDREVRRREERARAFDDLVACGRRRDALAMAATAEGAIALGERAAALSARRATSSTVSLRIGERTLLCALGKRVVLGRGDATIAIASTAVSRRHVELAREGGDVVLTTLGATNGVRLRGLAVEGSLRVGDGVHVELAREVSLDVRPSETIEGAIDVVVGGLTYVAPLGALALPNAPWRIDRGGDGWCELHCDKAPALLNGLAVTGTIELVRGDAFAREPGGAIVLRVES